MMEKEIWKPIKGYEGLYEVSNLGRIKSLKRTILRSDNTLLNLSERILKPGKGKYGRNLYTLCKNGTKTSIRGYRLVAEAFLENPQNLPEINHIDGNNFNDNVSNLEWVTLQENTQHAIENKLFDTYYNRFNNINYTKKEKKIMMKENSKKVLEYLKGINGANVTAADVADALGLEKRSVDGIFTSAIQRKGLGVRTPAEIELEDGTHKAVKFLSLTDEGMAFDPDAEE